MQGFSEKHKSVAGQIMFSLLTNSFYRDMHIDLVENTAAYFVRRVIQFRYTDDYVEEMLELFHELKSDFYASEQYRKDSFSFKSFAAMMRLSHKRLVENMRNKKRKLNNHDGQGGAATGKQQIEDMSRAEEAAASNKPSLITSSIITTASRTGEPKRIFEKKIIDHEEFMSIDYKFNYT